MYSKLKTLLRARSSLNHTILTVPYGKIEYKILFNYITWDFSVLRLTGMGTIWFNLFPTSPSTERSSVSSKDHSTSYNFSPGLEHELEASLSSSSSSPPSFH